jgi:hypothetical protein
VAAWPHRITPKLADTAYEDARQRARQYGIIVLHFTPREIRSEPASVVAAIAGAVKAGSARPALPVAVRRASA